MPAVVQCDIAPRTPSELTSRVSESEAGMLPPHIKPWLQTRE